MKIQVNKVIGNSRIEEVGIEDIVLDKTVPYIMSIDGSCTNTGVAIIRLNPIQVIYTIAFTREKDTESAVRYKIGLKKAVQNILLNNMSLSYVFYEQPFIGYAQATAQLFMLRTFVEELIIENEPELDYIKHYEINNVHWKSLFLSPNPIPASTQLQKNAIKDKLVSILPYLSGITQDEMDATSMGIVAARQVETNASDVESKLTNINNKVRPFQFNIKFIGADTDDEMLEELPNILSKVPDVVTENGMEFVDFNRCRDFNKKVYASMGNMDKVVIAKYSSGKFGNLTLQYRISDIVESYENIYAVVWRKSRKK